MICKTLYDLPLTIKQNRKFDYVYIDDLMPVIDHFIANKGEYGAYNVTPDKAIELFTLVEKVKKISAKDLPIKVARPGMGLEYSGDNARLRREIKGLKFTDIDMAIEKLYDWYEDNKGTIKKECLLIDK